MGLERVHFPGLGGQRLVHRTQALGDFLLFGGLRRKRQTPRKESLVLVTCRSVLRTLLAKRRKEFLLSGLAIQK
jgi:hypothetical protein